MTFNIITEQGEKAQVTFMVTETPDAEDQTYGICGTMTILGNIVEESTAAERFFTKQEAEKTIEMLCKYEVTPITLCEVI